MTHWLCDFWNMLSYPLRIILLFPHLKQLEKVVFCLFCGWSRQDPGLPPPLSRMLCLWLLVLLERIILYLRHSQISSLGSLIAITLRTVIDLLCQWVQCILNLAFPVVKCLDIMLVAAAVVHIFCTSGTRAELCHWIFWILAKDLVHRFLSAFKDGKEIGVRRGRGYRRKLFLKIFPPRFL